MTLAKFILLALKLSIMINVVALGLISTPKDVLYLFARPRLLLRSMLAMNVVMPVMAAMLAAAFDLTHAVKIALVALSVSPVPPLFPKTATKAAAGRAEYPIGLLVAASLLAVVFTPLAVDAMGNVFGTHVHVPVAMVVRLVFMTVLAPLAIGIVLRRLMPVFSRRMARPVSLIATILLIAALLPVLFTAGKAMWSLVGNGTLAAMAGFVVVGLATGHLFAEPVEQQRSVLALATALRHPGMAIAIAGAAAPQQKLVAPAILLYLFVGAIFTTPYLMWRRKVSALPSQSQQDEEHRAA
jgi:BASS family bile acid:Na+ symporter